SFVEFKARLSPPLEPLRPGGYDFARDMYFRLSPDEISRTYALVFSMSALVVPASSLCRDSGRPRVRFLAGPTCGSSGSPSLRTCRPWLAIWPVVAPDLRSLTTAVARSP